MSRLRQPISARSTPDDRLESGYSLLELMLTIAVITVVSGIAVTQIGAVRLGMKGDGGMRVVAAQLNAAREQSISGRRTVQVKCIGPNTLQIIRNEVPNGTTLLNSVEFEGDVEYALVPGVPDTPDAFGMGAAVDFGPAATVMFTSDGTLINETGNPINGTIFLAVHGTAGSARAVTVLGATGRVRAYRWDGTKWVRV